MEGCCKEEENSLCYMLTVERTRSTAVLTLQQIVGSEDNRSNDRNDEALEKIAWGDCRVFMLGGLQEQLG